MKKLVLSIATMFAFLGVLAQEKEINAAFDAVEANNTSSAKTELSKVESQINSNTISPDLKAKYYYSAGQIALKEGKSIEAAKLFGELGKFESGTMYSIRNKATKATEYYFSKSEAESIAANGDYSKPKEEVLAPNLLTKVQDNLRSKAEGLLHQANAAYKENRDVEAGDKFLEASYLVKAIGGDAGLFKYNAALSYHKGENYQKAFDTYKELVQEGYTGESVSWVGKNKETGEEVSFASKQEADLQVKLLQVTGLKEVKTPSVEKDLYTYTLRSLNGLKKYDEIIESISAKYPNDSEIQTLTGNILHNSGNQDRFLTKLIENTKIDPKEPSNFYNIGVIMMNQNNNAEAIQNFEKAIQLDPNFKNAYTNLALVKIKPEKEFVEIMNSNLGNSAKEKKTYQEYSQKRKDLYKEVIPYLEKAYELDKTNFDAVKTLRQAYQAAEMFDKEDALREVEKNLQTK